MRSFTKLLFTGIALFLLSAYGNAQEGKQKISSVVGKLIRVTPKLADIDGTTMYGEPLKITRDMKGIIGISEEGEEKFERREKSLAKKFIDPLIQQSQSPSSLSPNAPITTINQNFDGLSWSAFDPSDNNLAVGSNHVIQMINDVSGSRFKIWTKAGVVVGPAAGTILSSVTGVSGAGDPVVMYDQLADRWILTEFGPSACCNSIIVAVSVTPDPTGAYKVYQYTDPSFFPDYPKFSVWHNAYYGRTSDFNAAGTAFLGGSIWAFDRNAMLAGAATATMVRVRLVDAGALSYYNMNTIGLDGTTPSSQNGLFAVPNQANSTINIFEFTPNFTTPASSVVGPLTPITVAAYNLPPTGVIQQGSGIQPQTLGQRLMYRLSYRNRAGVESILIGHTVSGGAVPAAARWYEFRRTAGTWNIHQQGTITGADGNSRWMPGISMDANGNIAVMYNVAGPALFPSIRYTARNECDPLGQMTLPEQTIINGTVAHTIASRWGDYNTLWADPSIIGSFWGTAQYGGGSGNATRISNFTISGGAASFTSQPSNTTVCAGTTASFTAVAAGNPPITYQWQVSTNGGGTWTDIVGATASTYSFTAAAGDNGKQFRCVATSSCGSGNSNAATLTITTLSQGGTVSPATSIACAGGNSTTLTLSGSIGNVIRWESSIDGGTTWVNIANTTTTLTATNITQTTLYRALVQSSGCTAAYSANATINFVTPGVGTLTITTDNGTTLCAGDPTLLTAVGLTSNTFSNPAAILVPGTGTSGIAGPYPSNLVVSGLSTTGVSVKSVTLSNISHTWASDMSFVLQSPSGQNVILMSAVNGNNGISNVTYTFDDAAATGLGTASPSGTYKPTNNSTTRNWPAPGPGTLVQGVNPLLSSFTGDPNGTWKLYAIDAVGGDVGTVAGGYSMTFTKTGIIPGLSYVWSPAAGLNATNTNPVAASPAVTTTYTVVASSPSGCTGTASIAITVNQRPKVTAQPVNVSVCDQSTATFSITATGTGIAYQWEVSTNGGVSYTALANGTPYAGVTTNTLTINPVAFAMNNNLYRCTVSGICTPAASSTGAKLTVVALPAVTVTPASGCGGVAGVSGLLLTASGANTYVWAPVTGLYTSPTTTPGSAYTGTNTATVYAAPTAFTAYTVSGTSTATGCVGTATALVNYTPPAPTVTPASVLMCLGDPAVKLMSSSSTTTTLTVASGTLHIPILDADPAGTAPTSLNVAGIPAGATISSVSVTLNVTHTYIADMTFNLKAPNGQVLNLDKNMGQTGNPGANFTNTVISSAGTAALSGGAQPYTATFKADLINGGVTPGYTYGDPTGFAATAANWAALYSVPNGTWTLAGADDGAGDVGFVENWTIKITYVLGVPATPGVWTPAAGLFSNAGGTIPYVAGTAVDSVWAMPTPSGVYPYQVTVNSLPPAPAFATTNFANNNGNSTITFNVRNNNPYAVTLSDISSVPFAAGTTQVAAYYKTSAINGLPGAISAANGWNPIGTATINATAGTIQPFLTNQTLTIPAGATYGICVEALLAGGFNLAYSTIAAGTYTFPAGNGCDIITGTNIGYGGVNVPAAPTFTPRGFIGSVGFKTAVTACTSPARTVVVTVNQPIAFTTQPVDVAICTDKVASFTAVATGSSISHNWKVSTNNGNSWSDIANGGVYAGVKTGTLTITAPPVSMNGYLYKDSVSTTPCAPRSSAIAKLTVNPLPTIVISASPYQKLFPGLKTTLFSTVTPAAQSYAWLKNGTAVPGATASSLLVDVDGLGTYTLRVTDVNGCTKTSDAISLTDSISGKVFIYPTPNSGTFQVRYYSIINNTNLPRGINIYDARGKRIVVKTYAINAPYQRMDVDLRNYGAGVYWVEVIDVAGNRLAIGRTEVLR